MINKLKNLGHLIQALYFLFYYRYPAKNLIVIGVTGTDGKTTTVHLIYNILKAAGKKVGFISTIEARIGEEIIDTGFHVTTPDSWAVQRLLREMANQKIEYVIIESTSHGLDQHRLLGCNFKIGVLTNVTHEHLDYHKTFEKYRQSKAKLFKKVKYAVLNKDDLSFPYFSLVNKKAKIISYGLDPNADYNLKNYPFKTSLPGDYNLSNCLAAISTAKIIGIEDNIIRKALENFSGLTGRLELVSDKNHPFKVYVDFAHTPNGLENALQTLQRSKTKDQRLIVVFGCAGLRDVTKRPLMGEIAVKLADIAVLTAEDPRTEEVNEIIDQIARGCLKGGAKEKNWSNLTNWPRLEKGKWFFRIPDRMEAIRFAVQKLAQKGDTVVICGKGHEKSMCYGKIEIPWSDQEAVRKILK